MTELSAARRAARRVHPKSETTVVSARIATTAPLGDAVPVVVTIGGAQSRAGVTLVIR